MWVNGCIQIDRVNILRPYLFSSSCLCVYITRMRECIELLCDRFTRMRDSFGLRSNVITRMRECIRCNCSQNPACANKFCGECERIQWIMYCVFVRMSTLTCHHIVSVVIHTTFNIFLSRVRVNVIL